MLASPVCSAHVGVQRVLVLGHQHIPITVSFPSPSASVVGSSAFLQRRTTYPQRSVTLLNRGVAERNHTWVASSAATA